MGSDVTPAPNPKAPYDIGEHHAAWDVVVDEWEWHGSKEQGWRKSGPCPRCGHNLVVTASGGVLARALRRRVTARCACAGEHVNHPDRDRRDWGCGYSCVVKPPS